MSLVAELRTRVASAHTSVQKLLAAPDRRRRRAMAANVAIGQAEAALQPTALRDMGFSMAELPDSTRRALLADWTGLKRHLADNGRDPAGRRATGKIFFEEMLALPHLAEFPAFLQTAIDEQVLASMVRVTGMIPHLESVDILASRAVGDALSASQLWHYDVNDDRILKLFVYLEDTWEANGPFTFIDARHSARVAGALGHYVDDATISGYVPRDQWQIVEGAAGTAFFIDTGRCYHFGSRCREPRYAYIATYSSGLKFMNRSRVWPSVLGQDARSLSALQREVCGLN